MALSKMEIQQMLREMNVKFHADESLEELKQRLQQENHNLWLKSVSGNRPDKDKPHKIVVRKRPKNAPPRDPVTDSPDVFVAETERKPASRPPAARQHRPEPVYHRQAIEKPEPGKPWKTTADGTEPFNRKKKVFESVLRRARKCCECCGKATDEATGTPVLEPYHILPLDMGGEHSTKNVVALCPSCLKNMRDDPDSKSIKELKRKTRTKLYDSLEVVRKKKVRGQ